MAFTHHGHPYILRLSNNASIMQAELTAIHAALSRGLHSPSRCVVFTDSKSALQSLLQHHPNDNVSLLMGIRDVASRKPTPPILAWIPSHIGINEIADRAARQTLLKPAIDTYLPLSKARTRQNIKQTARDIYETLEQLIPSRSISLHQHVSLSISDSKALLSMTSRSDQRAIYRLRLFVRPYNQIRHTYQAVCPYCDEHFDIYTVHYICMCPASQVHRSKLLVDVLMYNIDNTPLTLEIIMRQGARRHTEIIQLIHRFPAASQNFLNVMYYMVVNVLINYNLYYTHTNLIAFNYNYNAKSITNFEFQQYFKNMDHC